MLGNKGIACTVILDWKKCIFTDIVYICHFVFYYFETYKMRRLYQRCKGNMEISNTMSQMHWIKDQWNYPTDITTIVFLNTLRQMYSIIMDQRSHHIDITTNLIMSTLSHVYSIMDQRSHHIDISVYKGEMKAQVTWKESSSNISSQLIQLGIRKNQLIS